MCPSAPVTAASPPRAVGIGATVTQSPAAATVVGTEAPPTARAATTNTQRIAAFWQDHARCASPCKRWLMSGRPDGNPMTRFLAHHPPVAQGRSELTGLPRRGFGGLNGAL